MFVIKRSQDNPILVPTRDHHWEAFATYNMSVVKKGKSIYGLYRAISSKDALRTPDQISTIGIARSLDGLHFDDRKQFIEPSEEWEKFGCEDPRVTFFEGRYYIFYTALSVFPFAPEGIRAAVAISDDLKKNEERYRVTTFNSKAMTLFPERINGKVTVLFSAHTDGAAAKMVIAQADNISEFWSPEFWDVWYIKMNEHEIEKLRRDNYDHVEVGAAPIKTKYGWLLIYSHIQNFFPGGVRGPLFGIEALLLDLNDPRKVIGRTGGPMMVPEEPYEISGHVSNVVFPSGTLLENGTLTIYYGASDTTVCSARVNISDLVSTISAVTGWRYRFKRFEGNPVIVPNQDHPWESKATFNPAAINLGGKTHILYRALSNDNTSTIGYAASVDGVKITERLSEPIYVPREDFENKKIEGANSGCEDPRITKIGKDLYMCYTAYDGVGPPRVAVTSIREKDFLARCWNWSKPELITPKGVDDKDTCIFPEKVGGKYLVLHRIGTDICADFLKSLDFKKETVNKCIRIFGPRPGTWDSAKVGITAPPIKTKKGWILLYHAVSEHHHSYRIGAVLLDLKDPTVVLSRSADPILEPEQPYEKEGIVPNVVFPCGMVVRNGLVYIYYGGADKVIGVATMELDILMLGLRT
ncbi:MAG: Glycosidase-related protein [Microgenomates group bacterium GW2011_GWA1_Microgenomates_45_10]|nr:MAG: Glycosidase-related protein [Microgenomates group bacterium GW2011_GWA1_Microgenomates_45_10]